MSKNRPFVNVPNGATTPEASPLAVAPATPATLLILEDEDEDEEGSCIVELVPMRLRDVLVATESVVEREVFGLGNSEVDCAKDGDRESVRRCKSVWEAAGTCVSELVRECNLRLPCASGGPSLEPIANAVEEYAALAGLIMTLRREPATFLAAPTVADVLAVTGSQRLFSMRMGFVSYLD